QIGGENVHRVRALMEEVFGAENFRSEIKFKTTGGHSSAYISSVFDSVHSYGREAETKDRRHYFARQPSDEEATQYKYGETEDGTRGSLAILERGGQRIDKVFQPYPLVSMGPSERDRPVFYEGRSFNPTKGRHWSVTNAGMER